MAGKSRRPKLILSPEQKEELARLSHARGSPAREVQRAQILCRFEAGETITQIARALKTTRPSVRKWVDKALAMGASAALKDTWHRPHAPVITDEAKAWIVHLACSKPKEHGYAAELWTRSVLARHVRQHAEQAGHPSLTKAVKAPRRSARIDHFRSPKVTHTKNTICRWARKTTSDIIHAEGVRFAVPSSAPQARNALSLREDIRALGKSISHRSAAPPGSHVICLRAKAALPSGKSATSFRRWWVTFGEQSRVISRERRRRRPRQRNPLAKASVLSPAGRGRDWVAKYGDDSSFPGVGHPEIRGNSPSCSRFPNARTTVRYNVSQGDKIMATTMVHVRVDEKTKQRAAKTLAGMGISVSDAVRMLLVRVAAEKALPFEVRVPNATTVKAMRAADRGKGKRSPSANALFKDLGI